MQVSNLRGFTLLEVTISTAIFTIAIGGFIGMVRLTSKSMGTEMALSDQARRGEQQIDILLIGMRWIAVKDPELEYKFPSGTSRDMPKITFRRIKEVNSAGVYIYGDRITYFWLPSGKENPKYAIGDASLYDPDDINGIDHDNNGVANDGVIWRKIEDADISGGLDDLGYESFVGTSDLRVVFENVPPPFCKVSDVVTPLDSFRVEVNKTCHSVTITLKQFIYTGDTITPDRSPRPETVPLTDLVIRDSKITVLTTKRTLCTRN
ncbi:MAG: prepilin-type N-terminal cleavage/methylation domain-containing protein [Planctomycetota bacterium]